MKPGGKRELRETIAQLEAENRRLHAILDGRPPLTFDVLTICWSKRTVSYRGQTNSFAEQLGDCLSLPMTNDVELLTMASRLRWQPIAQAPLKPPPLDPDLVSHEP